MSKIKFIGIEGVDCSGKSTLVKSLEKHYNDLGKKIKIFRQPGSTPVGNALREVIMSTDMDETTRIMLFVASRMEFYSNEILPLLNDGKDDEVIVITDRWFHSTIAYNVDGNKHHEDFYFDKMLSFEQKLDACFYLDVSPDVAQKRLQNRNEEQNRFDIGGLEVYQKRVNTYKQIALADKTMYCINADFAPEVVLANVVNAIDKINYRSARLDEIIR